MHYIIGTSFVVLKHTNNWDSKFKIKEQYNILSITAIENGLKYIFGSRSGRVEMIFESGRQADGFIASHKKEVVPDYDTIYQKNTSL